MNTDPICPMHTLPMDRLATIVLEDGREVVGCAQMSSIKGFGPMVYGRLGLWYDKDGQGGGEWRPIHQSRMVRVDCDGLKPAGWRPLPNDWVDPYSGQALAESAAILLGPQ
jgi:hypothetical protein